MTQPAGDGFFPPRFRAEIWATRRVPTEASRSSDRERLLGELENPERVREVPGVEHHASLLVER